MQNIQKISFIFLLFIVLKTNAQQFTLKIESVSKENISYKKEHKDSLSVVLELNYIVQKYHKKSFLVASVDSIIWKNKEATAHLHLGEKVQWATVSSGNISPDLLRKIDFKERLFSNKPIKAKALFKIEEQLINYCSNHGFPFATVRLDSVFQQGNKVGGKLLFDKGNEILFDSIQLKGDTKTKVKFIQNYIQIKPNSAFNQQKIDKATRLIEQLQSVKITKHYELQFVNDRAIIYLYLDDKKTNSIDGIAGFQQNPKDKKLLFTGQFDVGLKNIAGTGKAMEMHWKKTDVASQLLNLKYTHLSLFGSSIHTALRFQLFKQDSTFIQRKPYIELYYNHPVLGKLKFFYEIDDSRTIGKTGISDYILSPTFLSVKTAYYGVGIEWNNLDNLFFPRKGLMIELNTSAGNKKILNTYTPEISSRSLQLKLDAKVEKHWRINEFLGLYSKVSGSLLQNDNLYLNELFRLGGIQSFRGFREYNFYASQYAIGTLESRFYIDKESYFLLFSDYGFYENSIKGEKPAHNGPPIGLGAGLTFSTKTGVFSFIYAVGREGTKPVNFTNSVVNFGLTSHF